jgi:hypothetical protein
MTHTRERLARLLSERETVQRMQEDVVKKVNDDDRDPSATENEELTRYRTRIPELDSQIDELTGDLERAEKATTSSALIRVREPEPVRADLPATNGEVVYRTFAQFARDRLITTNPRLLAAAAGSYGDTEKIRHAAQERLERVEHTLTEDVPGLLPPTHMAQILDIINGSRPVVNSARSVDLSRGTMTYPKIAQRPEVLLQSTEKTEGGTAEMQVELKTLTAGTYIGGGNLSWQTINWSTPDALQLWFDLAAEAYARQTEDTACDELEGAAGSGTAGTVSPRLGTAGTEDFGQWRAAAIGGAGDIYTTTAGRARTDTLYLSADMFFNLAAVGTSDVVQMSAIGSLDIGSMTGNFSGFRVVGSYGFAPGTAILGDASAFLVGETPGAPVELRAVEPAIGGMEVGVIGAFAARVFDTQRFLHLS